MPGPKQAVRTSLSDPHQHLFYAGQSKEYSVTLLSPEKPPRACLSTVLSADVPVLCPCDHGSHMGVPGEASVSKAATHRLNSGL